MQVDSIKPKLKPPGSERLKLECDTLLSTFAFKFNLRRYGTVTDNKDGTYLISYTAKVSGENTLQVGTVG